MFGSSYDVALHKSLSDYEDGELVKSVTAILIFYHHHLVAIIQNFPKISISKIGIKFQSYKYDISIQ